MVTIEEEAGWAPEVVRTFGDKGKISCSYRDLKPRTFHP
jgi:hypothetical protein